MSLSRSSDYTSANDSAGHFAAHDVPLSQDGLSWNTFPSVFVTKQGGMFSEDEYGNHLAAISSLQACSVTINPALKQPLLPKLPSLRQSGFRRIRRGQPESSSGNNPIVCIKSTNNQKLYIRCTSQAVFDALIHCLAVWQAFRPQGLAKKHIASNLAPPQPLLSAPHEVLVARFKVFGPIPTRTKVNVIPGVRAPFYQSPHDIEAEQCKRSGETSDASRNGVNEGWFYTMGVLKSNGSLNFLAELDGQLLYSINVTDLLSSEIRKVDHSLFSSSNIIFIGVLKELRFNNVVKSTTTLPAENYAPEFLSRDGRSVASNNRILIEFPLHIDLEDWLVGLSYFAKHEYIGSYAWTLNTVPKSGLDTLQDFESNHLRVSKTVNVDIIEANLTKSADPHAPQPSSDHQLYAEIRLWGLPWSRTAAVDHTLNPFWKEKFSTELPILTQTFHIFIRRKSIHPQSNLVVDEIVGTTFVTPDILARNMDLISTITSGNDVVGELGTLMSRAMLMGSIRNSVASASAGDTSLSTVNPLASDIVRLPIYNSANAPIGKLLLDIRLLEFHVLRLHCFTKLEDMLLNAPMADLVRYCAEEVKPAEFEHVSVAILDIFQILGIEEKWFRALMEHELIGIDKLTRKQYRTSNALSPQKDSPSSANNVFNTLFRGSSIFSKSLEKYILRIGREYLEKVFQEFFGRLLAEDLDCEVDPRIVRAQYMAALQRSRQPANGASDDESLSSLGSEEEQWHAARVQEIVDDNYQHLLSYAEEMWRLILSTSNDLPDKIKAQLTSFRLKVELACDPNDKTTALNCLSGFIFLRFMCPVILNPKLFYLTVSHQTGNIQRTLTLLAKILLNLANRQKFSSHKEPHLLRMNSFLEMHSDQVLDYYDRITGRKNDFNEKVLGLSHGMRRFDMGLGESSLASELPTTPYLLDKQLRFTELIQLLAYKEHERIDSSTNLSKLRERELRDPALRESGLLGDLIHDANRNVYQIGLLEFEKAELMDFVGNDETEGFIKSFCRSDSAMFSFIDADVTLADLRQHSTILVQNIHDMVTTLDEPEPCIRDAETPRALFRAFAADALTRLYLDTLRNTLVSLDPEAKGFNTHVYRLVLNPSTFSALRLKFDEESEETEQSPVQEPEVGTLYRQLLNSNAGSSRNLFKKLFKK